MVLPERAEIIENRIDIGDCQAKHRRLVTQDFFILEHQRNGQDRPNGAALDAQQHLKRGTAAGTQSGDEDVGVKNDPVGHTVSYMILPESAIPVGDDAERPSSAAGEFNKSECAAFAITKSPDCCSVR